MSSTDKNPSSSSTRLNGSGSSSSASSLPGGSGSRLIATVTRVGGPCFAAVADADGGSCFAVAVEVDALFWCRIVRAVVRLFSTISTPWTALALANLASKNSVRFSSLCLSSYLTLAKYSWLTPQAINISSVVSSTLFDAAAILLRLMPFIFSGRSFAQRTSSLANFRSASFFARIAISLPLPPGVHGNKLPRFFRAITPP